MKHLLSGVALGAVLAIALPLWAQAPSTPDDKRRLSSAKRETVRVSFNG